MNRAATANAVFVPLLFIVIYMLPLSSAIGGREVFDLFMQVTDSLPAHALIEGIFFVLFVAYALKSLALIYSSSVGSGFCWNLAGVTYVARRLAMFVSIPFVAHFFIVARLPYIFTSSFLDFAKMKSLYGDGTMLAFFCAGFSALVFVGTSSAALMAFEWGLTVSARSRLAALVAAWMTFVALSAWGARVIVAF